MLDPEAPLDPAPRGSFLGHVNIVLATYALDGLLAFATGVLIARGLGTEGRGAYAIFVLSVAFGQLVLGLGAGNAAIYYLNRNELRLRDVISAMHVLVIGALVVSAVIVAAIVPFAGEDLLGEGIPAWLFILAVPALLWMNLLRLVLQALSRFVDLGITTVGQQLVLLAVVASLVAAGDLTPARASGCLIGASAAAAVYALLRLGLRQVDLAQVVRPRVATLRTLATFGVQGEAGNILQLLNYRLDQYIVSAFVGLAGVGIYAVSASMTEAVFMLANAVALVLMPRLTSADDEDVRWMTPLATRNTMLIAAGGALVLAALAPFVLPAMFGSDYDRSVRALWLLLPGAVALTGSKVLTSYIFSRGRPLVNTGVTIASLAVTLVADLTLVPLWGVNGAAVASSLAYATHFAAALYAYRRMSGQPILEAVIPRAGDVHLYTDAVRDVLDRARGRHDVRPAEPTPATRGHG
jgi:O-antigen/teichoic acid export membrane protein